SFVSTTGRTAMARHLFGLRLSASRVSHFPACSGAPSHRLPQGSGQGIVAGQISTLEVARMGAQVRYRVFGRCDRAPRSRLPALRPSTAAESGVASRSDHLVGAEDQRLRKTDTECICCLEIKDQLELCWLLDRKIGRFCTF